MQQQKRVLFTVLDWGLGHATRSIPVIETLLNRGFDVQLAGEGNSLLLLKNHFPNLCTHNLYGIQVSFSNSSFGIIMMIPQLLNSIKREHQQFLTLCNELKPDLIISDNRYGAWHPTIQSIFIGHQLYLQAPNRFTKWIEPLLFHFHSKFLKRFSKVWIPDTVGENNLSGILAHHPSINQHLHCEFIGPLSRFSSSDNHPTENIYEVVVLISGPEPQRSIFQEACVKEAARIDKKTLILLGQPHKNEKIIRGNITLVSHLVDEDLLPILQQASFVVCRSGYSTLMDLAKLNKTALCIPTPGQTEQLYLAKHLSEQHKIIYQEQHKMNWEKGFQDLSRVKQLSFSADGLLNQVIEKLLL